MIFAHLKEQREADPLVVGHVSPLVLLVVGAGHDARVGHVAPHVEGEGAGDGVPGQSTLHHCALFILCFYRFMLLFGVNHNQKVEACSGIY